ncbi:MAG TPA: heavy metal translocating P-type ATPase [Bacillota bacterium]|nr:heavy metal translocating P-type ATPase [Bacillota bacterium]
MHDRRQAAAPKGIDKESIVLQITGMTCAACSARIEKGLTRMSGIVMANVNLALETAHVEYLPSEISTQNILDKISQLGYEPRIKNEGEGAVDEDYRQKEIVRLKNKLILSALLTFPLLWSMAKHFSFARFIWVPDLFMNAWFQCLLATPVQFLIGRQFYVSAYKALRNKSANMDVLVALGTSAAYIYSFIFTLIHYRQARPMVVMYYETSTILITFILLGKWLESLVKGRTSEAIKRLMNLQARAAVVIRDGKEISLPIEQVMVGDKLVIKPGEKVPVDGIILEGVSSFDESMITGESMPIMKKIGDPVIGATVNKHGVLQIRATKVGKDTALAQIVKIVEEAQGSKASIQRIADQVSEVFVPIVVTMAVLVFFAWYFFLAPHNLAYALEKLMAVLVIACPCALGLATPTSIMAGSGRAAELGVLFKGGEHLEATQKINTVVLDKTGTITKGKPELTDIISMVTDQKEFIRLVASVEKNSEHPLAETIVERARKKGIDLYPTTKFKASPGYGVQATVAGNELLIGNRKWLNRFEVDFQPAMKQMEQLEQKGKTTILVSINRKYAGIMAVADTIKPSSKKAVRCLQRLGIHVIMITGDNQRSAAAIAQKVGIRHVLAEILPEGKAEEIKKLQAKGRFVAMVGDGMNDAPALATADIGMAMGTGTDIAMETADVTLMRSDLNSVVDAILMSQKTMINIKQNLFWAFAYNSIAIPIAALGFLAPWVAGASMALSSVSVVLNALRLQRVRL